MTKDSHFGDSAGTTFSFYNILHRIVLYSTILLLVEYKGSKTEFAPHFVSNKFYRVFCPRSALFAKILSLSLWNICSNHGSLTVNDTQ